MYSVDSCFVKGADHTVCQDYTSHGFIDGDPNKPYIVLCDGCSSAKNSDFGARLLSRACEIAIGDITRGMTGNKINISEIENLIRSNLSSILGALAYGHAPVLATVMLAFIVDGITFTYSRGDGTIHVGGMSDPGHSSREQTTHVSYQSSAPFYLAYDLFRHWIEGYIQPHIHM